MLLYKRYRYTFVYRYTKVYRLCLLALESISLYRHSPNMELTDTDKRKCPSSLSKPECTRMLLPVQDALDLLSGKWKLQIILSLTFGKKRFKQMQREIPGLSPKMLSKELKELEVNQLLERRVYDSLPVTVEYELTAYGKTLKPLIGELHKWGAKHRKRIIAGGK